MLLQAEEDKRRNNRFERLKKGAKFRYQKTLDDTELLLQFKEVEEMGSEDKKTLKNVIDAFIKRSKLNQIAVL